MIELITNERSWRGELEKVRYFDFHHTWDFHQASKANGEGSPVMIKLKFKKGNIIWPLLEREIKGTSYKDLTSVYGYPSPLEYGLIDKDEYNSFFHYLKSFLFEHNYVSLFSRTNPFCTPEFIKEKIVEPCGDVVCIDLFRDSKEQLSQYRTNHKRDIKKLIKKGVHCYRSNEEREFKAFLSNYYETMMQLDASKYYFFPSEYLLELMNSRDFDVGLYNCKFHDEIICSGIFVSCGIFINYFLGGTNRDYVNMAPTKLMFDKVRDEFSGSQYKYFVLGGGLGGKESSLLNFKKGFSNHSESYGLVKFIINEEVYKNLASKGSKNVGCFFPCYRRYNEET